MNKDIIKGKWNEVKGRLKGRWGRLTDDDLMRIEGRSDELTGALQQRYGLAKEQAAKDADEFLASCCSSEERVAADGNQSASCCSSEVQAAADGKHAKPAAGGSPAPGAGRKS